MIYSLKLNHKKVDHHHANKIYARHQYCELSEQAAHQHGQLRATLAQQGIGIGALDLMIAAHAIALDLIIISNDRAFTYIPDLKLENWAN